MDAHKKYGCYDESFRLAADNYFFELVYQNQIESILWRPDCVLGYFKGGGISLKNMKETLYELYKSRIKSGRFITKEYFIYMCRKLKYRAF